MLDIVDACSLLYRLEMEGKFEGLESEGGGCRSRGTQGLSASNQKLGKLFLEQLLQPWLACC